MRRYIEVLAMMSLLGMTGVVEAAPGIVGKSAPEWGVTKWKQLPNGSTSLDVEDFKGKVP